MQMLYISIGLLTLPLTFIFSNLFWSQLRETRGIALLLQNRPALRKILTADVFTEPPTEIARFLQPVDGGYSQTLRFFQKSDEYAHKRGRAIMRFALAAVIIGSGVVGFLGLSWYGLVLPIANVLVMQRNFVSSTREKIDGAAVARAIEHLRIVTILLDRWNATDFQGVEIWFAQNPSMEPLREHLGALR